MHVETKREVKTVKLLWTVCADKTGRWLQQRGVPFADKEQHGVE